MRVIAERELEQISGGSVVDFSIHATINLPPNFSSENPADRKDLVNILDFLGYMETGLGQLSEQYAMLNNLGPDFNKDFTYKVDFNSIRN